MSPVQIGDATRTYIYALCEFPDGPVRYVGKTVQPLRQRLLAHQRAALRNQRLPVSRWLAKRRRNGLRVSIRWLDTVGADWQMHEAFWISSFMVHGAALLNLTTGGEGLPGHRFSAQHRARIATALRRGTSHCCVRCGASFYRKPKDARSARLFCSRNCANKHNKGGSRVA